MSTAPRASSSDSLAPAWLERPDDANDLAFAVWPASARRTDGVLQIGGVGVDTLRETYGTPLYVVDEREVRDRASRALAAFSAAAERAGTSVRVYYAGKALLTTEIVRWVTEEGLAVDVCSGGELEVALAAGAAPDLIGFHGNNKSAAELERAVDIGIGSIVIDSVHEIDRLAAIVSARPQASQRVLVRVNSGVHADTHDFLATAHEDQKFGFPLDSVADAVARLRSIDGVEFVGLHCHIGSQIFGADGFRESASRLLDLYETLRAGGEVPVLNLGGGFGVAYTRADAATPIEELADRIVGVVAEECTARGLPVPALAFEPGRAIVGPAGVTLYEVGTTKPVTVDTADGLASRLYVSVDGGMSDNARPALYGAHYSARIASRSSDADPALVRVVGKHCESGDIVVDSEYLPGDVAPGDLVAVPVTGAYCFSLASTYNWIARPAVVAVREGEARLIVRPVTVADLMAYDVGAAATEGEG